MTTIKVTVVDTFGGPLTIEVPAGFELGFAAIASVRCAGITVFKRSTSA
jgi:hypothetical protein